MYLFAARPLGYPRRTHLGTAISYGEKPPLTSCGISIQRDWSVHEVSRRLAEQDVTCLRCRPRIPSV